MAAMMLMIINFNDVFCVFLKCIIVNMIAAISWPPPLISHLVIIRYN